MDRLLAWASVSGRANRKPYWLTALAACGVAIVCIVAMAPFLPGRGEAASPGGIIAIFVLALPILYMLWVCIAVSIRRLHDRDKSAWWLLPYMVLPMIFDIITGDDFGAMGPLIILKIASILITIWVLVDLGFLKGTAGPNRYGPDPLATALTGATASDIAS